MSAELHYFSPTTPGASSFDEDITDAVRLGEIGGLSADAQLGATGTSGQVLDDPDSTLGHAADGIVGLKQAYLNETTAPVGNRRVWTGYTGERTYRRGDDSLRLGVSRKIDLTLVELDNSLDFRVFAPVADDPTSSFDRGAESTIERIQGLLTDVDFLSTTLFDIGYIPTTGGVDMDANDYTGQRPSDVLNDIAQVSGWNYFLLYDEASNQVVLWFDDWKTDGTSTVVYDSSLKLTNVDSERDSVTFAISPDATEVKDPSRVISGVWVMGKGTNVYRTRPETAWTFGWRDAVMEAQYLSDPVKLAALGDRYLLDNSTEDAKITCTVQLPAALVTGIHKGQRIQMHATHLPSVASDFVWCRILSLTVRQDQETEEFYWLDLELSPIVTVVPYLILYRAQTADGGGPLGWVCGGDGVADGLTCNSGSYPSDPSVGPLHGTLGTFGGTIAPTTYLGFEIDGTGTIDITWGPSGFELQVFGAAGGLTATVELLLNGSVVGTSAYTTPGGGSGHIMTAITLTGLAVTAGDLFTARMITSPPSTLYIDGGNLVVTGGALTP